ncbi:hypothetical protein Agabi119p4_10702 [Agaricus bisporus var. burnettii]|uniref:F-box domain-containing protein n=1 Tax=Agaricus bisporus var. burnettii TaxID=192524 RepID=A0A8H7C333_AGABI|nr:hypothetical protein Agabi119p4_10702 [Agaricus bisporus var. burnettii]
MNRRMSLQGGTSSWAGINDLPNEILLHILFKTISYTQELHEWFFCVHQHSTTRVTIMKVCRRWFQLTQGSPKFWTSFTIGNPWGDPNKTERITPRRELLEIGQARSGNWPIYINLYHGSFSAYPQDSIFMMTALSPSINRWGRIDLALDEGTASAFLDLHYSSTAGLKEIRACSFCSAETNNRLLEAFGLWPNLQKLVWIFATGLPTTDQPTFHNRLCCFPWKHLRDISLEVSWTLTEFLAFFKSSTSAEIIRLNMRRHPTGSSDLPLHPIVNLPKLRYLGIESDSGVYCYVGYLNFPGIKCIALSQKIVSLGNSWGTDPSPIPSTEFQQFLNRTARSAQGMIVHGYPFSAAEAVRLFSNEDMLCIPVIEIDVGEAAAAAIVEHMKSNTSSTIPVVKRQGRLVGWCHDEASCRALNRILPSFDFKYHGWMHPYYPNHH